MHPYLTLYAKFCALLIFLVIVVGFICPALVSSDDMFFVSIGFTLLLVVPPAVVIYAWHAYKVLTPPNKGKK